MKKNLLDQVAKVSKKLEKPLKELPKVALGVTKKAVTDQAKHTKDYVVSLARHLKTLPKTRSFQDASHFAQEAGDRTFAYAKKTFGVIKHGAQECQGWIKKTMKGLNQTKRSRTQKSEIKKVGHSPTDIKTSSTDQTNKAA